MRKIGGLVLLVLGGGWLQSSYQDAAANGDPFAPFAIGTYIIPIFVIIGGIAQLTKKKDETDSGQAEA